jgi:putative two-component system response regulator
MSVSRSKRDLWRERLHASVLVVDDDANVSSAMAQLLERDGHRTIVAGDVGNARRQLRDGSVDVVVCDVRLPGESGLTLAKEVARHHPDVAVVMISGWGDLSTAEAALDSGADRFLAKPFGPDELLIAVSDVLRRRQSRVKSLVDSRRLEEDMTHLRGALRDLNAALQEARRDTLLRLALAADCRLPGMGPHLRRVGRVTELVARRMEIEPERCQALGTASTLHDVGQIGVPDRVLLKPGRLTHEERDLMRLHTVIGRDLLAGSGDPLLDLAATIAHTHHERVDGNGYPNGLVGEGIPLEGRIVSVVDAFDALISQRPHRPPLPVARALEVLAAGRGTRFDPRVLEVFIDHLSEIDSIMAEEAGLGS